MKEQLINSHSSDELTDETGTLGNTGQLRKVNSCCYSRLQLAENFTIPSSSQKYVHNYITTITANTKNKTYIYIYMNTLKCQRVQCRVGTVSEMF